MAVEMTEPPAPAGSRVRARGEEWTLSARTAHTDCESVRLTGRGSANAGARRTLLLPFDRVVPVHTGRPAGIVGRRLWLPHVTRLVRAAQPFGGLAAAAGADIRLMPFQFEPALAMLRHARLRLLIADEVGLGKTIQAGLILTQLSAQSEALRAIVLTPAGVREQWQHELDVRFALAATVADAAWLADRARDLPPEVNPWSLPGIYIASLDLVKRPEVLHALEDVTWDIAVVDEVHNAGPNTARLTAAHAVACTARRVVLLSATPPDGDPVHAAAIAGLGRLRSGEPLTAFRRTRAAAGLPARRKSILLPVRLSRSERRMHRLLERYTARVWQEAGARQDVRARLAAVILRKRALSSAASLLLSVRRRLALLGSTPDSGEHQLPLPLQDEDPLNDGLPDDVIGASGLSDVPLERACLAGIADAAEQAARSESKLALLRRLLERVREPVIVFTEYRDTLARLAAELAPLRRAVLLHGGMTARERTAAQRAFNASGSLLLATDAASEGLNLHDRCRIVVHFELPWTPARLEQRTGRVDRVGQSRAVHEILLVARDTCERLVLAPLVRRVRASAAAGGTGSRLSVLTESAVAGAVMQHAALPDAPPPIHTETGPTELAQEADDECTRLAALRNLGGPSADDPLRFPYDIAVMAARRRTAGSALVLVEVALERPDGWRVHTEFVPLVLDTAARPLPRRGSARSQATSAFIQAVAPAACAAAEAYCAETLAAVAEAYRRAAEVAERRERGIAGVARSAAQQLVQVGLFDSRGMQALTARRRAAALSGADADERLANLASGSALRAHTDCRRPLRHGPSAMITGMRGSLLSHDALAAVRVCPGDAERIRLAHAAIATLQSQLQREGGPAWPARTVFDRVAVPFCRALGFDVLPADGGSRACGGVLRRDGSPAAVIMAFAWGQEAAGSWSDSVRAGIGAGLRWCYCFTGPAIRVFDAQRTHSRRFVEFELATLEDRRTSTIALHVLSGPAALDAAVALSERHRTAVRDSLQAGVHEALAQLTTAFAAASRHKSRPQKKHTRTDVRPQLQPDLLDESLVVVYRVLFLLFAEARGLVPAWHPVFRESYTIDSLRAGVETLPRPRGVWEALQAIARLAHRGCRAGSLRVPPFNGRLFSPAHAPLAESVPLDDAAVRSALLALTTRRTAAGRQRIAYADLGVEHLGGVYERVLDYDIAAPAQRAPALVRSGKRKATGTFYTPRSLTEYLVRRTLSPLTREARPDDILALRILDPAMGSGAFLVAACRYLAYAYEAALVREGLVFATDLSERDRAGFRRTVAQRCLFGVDLNPMAVQLARLSLWLTTLSGDRPLTFFDHHLRTGNSLAGASIGDVRRRRSGGRTSRAPLPLLDDTTFEAAVGEAVTSRQTLREGLEDTIEQVRAKEALFAAIQAPGAPLSRWKGIADLWCAGWFDSAARDVPRATFGALLDSALGLPGGLNESSVARVLATGDAAAARERFFHWDLEFPDVFHGRDGAPLAQPGFDAIVGNPPWEMVRGDAGDAAARERKADDGSRLTRFARGSGIYRLQGNGHANLYQMFVERTLALLRAGGRLGLVLPSGFATDHGCAMLRRHVLDATAVDSVVLVENREGLFPIHRALKFVLLTLTKSGSTGSLPLRCGIRSPADFDQLPEAGDDPRAVSVPRRLIEQWSGDQLAIPELRTPADAAIAARLAFRFPAAADEGGWGLRFGRELNATEDRQHFNRSGAGIPVVEGKHIRPFAVDLGAATDYVDPEVAARAIGRRPFESARLAYRDVASATNRLTLIAAVLPARTITTHTLFCLRSAVDENGQQFLAGMLNSFVANYMVRLRVTTHVTVAIVERLPLPKPAVSSLEFVRMAALARHLASEPNDLDAMVRLQALAARLYEIDAATFAHILETFPLVDERVREASLKALELLSASP